MFRRACHVRDVSVKVQLSDFSGSNTVSKATNGIVIGVKPVYLLAEIADKMPTITNLWELHFVLATGLVFIAVIHRKLAIAAAIFSLIFPLGACHEAFFDGYFTECIWGELGRVWIVNSVSSSLLPLILVTIVVMAHRSSTANPWRIRQVDDRPEVT